MRVEQQQEGITGVRDQDALPGFPAAAQGGHGWRARLVPLRYLLIKSGEILRDVPK